MRKRVLSAIILLFLVLGALNITVNVVRGSPAKFPPENSSTQQNVNMVNVEGIVRNESGSESYVEIHSASGETETLRVPFEKYMINMFSSGNNTSFFINDLRNGDKVDVLLRNYTLLLQEGYLQKDNKVRVIVLTGDTLQHDTYRIHLLNEHETVALSEIVESLNGTITSTCNRLPFIVVEMPYEKIFTFSECNMIGHVFLDKKYKVCLSESVPIIKPEQEWRQIEEYFDFEINGSEVRIAILDTGIDKTHPDLENKVILEKCFTDEGKTTDGFGHGTHCASIAVGTGAASNDMYVGVAPGALLLNGKVLTDGGWGYSSWIIEGIEWAVEQNAQVISMSFGADINGDGTDPESMTVDWATDQGVTCVVAAGNSGYGRMFTVGIPAVAKKAITVGATTKTDYMAGFSSQGPTADYRLKPDVCAPGVDIVAARSEGTTMGDPIADYYTMASGTSMATPHVAGAAALVLQTHPDWSPLMIKSVLMGHAKMLANEHLWSQGTGRIDVCEATNATLLVLEPSASFGVLEPPFTANITFTIINTASTSQTINMSTFTMCDELETDYVHLNVTSLTISAYDKAYVMLVVGPLDEEAPDGWYEGWLNVTSQARYCIAPYLFTATSIINVCVCDVDSTTKISGSIALATYPDMKLIDMGWFEPGWQSMPYLSFHAKSGNYSICAQSGYIASPFGFDASRMFMIQKVFFAPKFSIVYVNLSLAEAYVNEIPTLDHQNRSLTTHCYTQYFSGDPYYEPYIGGTSMSWSMGSSWSGFDPNVSKLILYSSQYTPSDKLSQAFGGYASNRLLSEVYLLAWKFFDVSLLPSVITQEYSKLAKYNVSYDMPETYPENGLNAHSGFWFTWNYLGGGQGWGWDVHRVCAGINAKYYLTPNIALYWGNYMPTYGGWLNNVFGPLQEWYIGSWDTPPREQETGNLILGRFDFGPYAPGISLLTHHADGKCVINLTGNIWAGLDWPHWNWGGFGGAVSPYPQQLIPRYYLYVDEELVAQGILGRTESGDIWWDDMDYSWEVAGERALLQLHIPSLATISKETIYNINFSLTENLNIPPMFYDMVMPLNYYPKHNITIWPKTPITALFHISNISLSYSFDDGATWRVASKAASQGFVIPCEEADKLAILIDAMDNKGNTFQYFSNPVAMCKKANLNKTTLGSSIVITAATLNDNPICDVALRIDANDSSFYASLDSSGRAILPASIGRIKAWFPEVGLYAKNLTPLPDVAVTNITLSSYEVYLGRPVNISVTVKNKGEFPETFSVKTCYDNQFIDAFTVSNLAPGMSTTLTFRLNTTEFTPYSNYTIKAQASIIPYEINVANNVLIKGTVGTRALGDANGDKKIDILDIVLIASVYGCREGKPNWDPFADVAPDWGKIDILDLVTCASHYGETYS